MATSKALISRHQAQQDEETGTGSGIHTDTGAGGTSANYELLPQEDNHDHGYDHNHNQSGTNRTSHPRRHLFLRILSFVLRILVCVLGIITSTFGLLIGIAFFREGVSLASTSHTSQTEPDLVQNDLRKGSFGILLGILISFNTIGFMLACVRSATRNREEDSRSNKPKGSIFAYSVLCVLVHIPINYAMSVFDIVIGPDMNMDISSPEYLGVDVGMRILLPLWLARWIRQQHSCSAMTKEVLCCCCEVIYFVLSCI